MGKKGLREVAEQCLQKTAYLRSKAARDPRRGAAVQRTGLQRVRRAHAVPRHEILADLEHDKILGGIPLGDFYEGHDNDFLVAVTELHTREQLDQYAGALSAAISRERR